MSFHSNLILVRHLIDCIDHSIGCCYGFTLRWTEAVYLNQVHIFKKRAQLIQHLSQSPELIFFILANIKRKKGQGLVDEEIKFIDVLGFMDSITLYQYPHYIYNFLNPHEKNALMDIQSISTYAASDEIQKMGGLIERFALTRIYTKAELNLFIRALTELLITLNLSPDENIVFSFSSHNHITALAFNASSCWEFMDINQYPSKQFSTQELNQLNHHLYKALSYPSQNNVAPFHMALLTPKDFAISSKLLNKLEEFRALFAIKSHEVLRRNHQDICISYLAAQFNDAVSIKELFQFPPNLPNQIDMCVAIKHGSLKVLIELAQYQLKSKNRVFNYSLALHLSIKYNHFACVKYLLSLGIHPNHANLVLGDALFTASLYGCPDMTQLLLAHGANPLKASFICLAQLKQWIGSNHSHILDKISLYFQDEHTYLAFTPKKLAAILGYSELEHLLGESELKLGAIYQLGLWIDHEKSLDGSISTNIFKVIELTYHYSLETPSPHALLSCKIIYDYLNQRLKQDDVLLLTTCFASIKDHEIQFFTHILRYIANFLPLENQLTSPNLSSSLIQKK